MGLSNITISHTITNLPVIDFDLSLSANPSYEIKPFQVGLPFSDPKQIELNIKNEVVYRDPINSKADRTLKERNLLETTYIDSNSNEVKAIKYSIKSLLNIGGVQSTILSETLGVSYHITNDELEDIQTSRYLKLTQKRPPAPYNVNTTIKNGLPNGIKGDSNTRKSFKELHAELWEKFLKNDWLETAEKAVDALQRIFNKSPLEEYATGKYASKTINSLPESNVSSDALKQPTNTSSGTDKAIDALKQPTNTSSGTDKAIDNDKTYKDFISKNVKLNFTIFSKKDTIFKEPNKEYKVLKEQPNEALDEFRSNIDEEVNNSVQSGNTYSDSADIKKVAKQNFTSRSNEAMNFLVKAGPDLLSNMYDVAFVRDNSILTMFSLGSYKEYASSTRASSEDVLSEEQFITIRNPNISIPLHKLGTTQIKFLENTIEAPSSKVDFSPESTFTLDMDFNLYAYQTLQHLAGHRLAGKLQNNADNGYTIQSANTWNSKTFDIFIPIQTLSRYHNTAFSQYVLGGKSTNAIYVFKDVRILGNEGGIQLSRSGGEKITLSFDFIFKNLEVIYKPDNSTPSVTDDIQVSYTPTLQRFSYESISGEE